MGKREVRAVGFLTIVRHDQQGLCGGYLLLNRAGRPLEFHCTAPVRPNRAQEILYGSTLEPYLCGEQIGQALVSKASAMASLVLTDVPAVLALRSLVEIPVALVGPAEQGEDAEEKLHRVDGPHGPRSPYAQRLKLQSVAAGDRRLAVESRFSADREAIAWSVGELDEDFDLAEPFERIREAIEEARRGAP